LVVAFHAGLPLPGGFVGVDVFFVISGFVITALLDREFAASGRIRFRRFFFRRFKRLTPALAIMLIFTMLVSVLVLSPPSSVQKVALTALGAIAIAANVVIARTSGGYFDAPAEANPLLNTWSLSVEEQFYLVFPVLLALGWILARRTRWARSAPIILVAILAVASFVLAIMSSSGWTIPGLAWFSGFYSPLTRAWEFAVGALLALGFTRESQAGRRLKPAAGWVGLTLIALSALLIDGNRPFPSAWTLLPVAGSALLLFGGLGEAGVVTRLLSTKPMVMIGDRSYSIYLWHWPFIVFAMALWPGSWLVPIVAAAISFLPALLSFQFVEEPLRSVGSRGPLFAVGLVAGISTPVIAIASLAAIAPSQGWFPASDPALAQAAQGHQGGESVCFRNPPYSPEGVWTKEACTWNSESEGDPIYLVGDSHADQFREAVIGAGRALDRPALERAISGCPFTEMVLIGSRDPDGCLTFVEETVSWLQESEPGVVLIASGDYYLLSPGISGGSDFDRQSFDTADKVEAYRYGLTSVVERIQRAGHQVVLVETIPNFMKYGPGEVPTIFGSGGCPLVTGLLKRTCQPVVLSLNAVEERQGLVWEAVRSVSADTGASVLSLAEDLCPQGTCSAKQGATWIYKDPNHITTEYSADLAPRFARAIRQLGTEGIDPPNVA
jgi:peptidoglycan/LPS O-acetylase OafA/YrhL